VWLNANISLFEQDVPAGSYLAIYPVAWLMKVRTINAASRVASLATHSLSLSLSLILSLLCYSDHSNEMMPSSKATSSNAALRRTSLPTKRSVGVPFRTTSCTTRPHLRYGLHSGESRECIDDGSRLANRVDNLDVQERMPAGVVALEYYTVLQDTSERYEFSLSPASDVSFTHALPTYVFALEERNPALFQNWMRAVVQTVRHTTCTCGTGAWHVHEYISHSISLNPTLSLCVCSAQ